MPPVPDVARVQLLWTVGTDTEVSTTTYWNYTGGSFSSGNAADMAEAIIAALPDSFAGIFGAQTTLVGCRVTDLSSESGGDGTASVSMPSTRTGGELPASTCVVMNDTIDRRYRGGKPRCFLPWGTVGDLLNENEWDTEFLTAALSEWQNFYAAVADVSAGGSTLTTHASVSWYSGFTVKISSTTGRARNVPTLRATPVVYNVLATAAGPFLGTQRRRIRG